MNSIRARSRAALDEHRTHITNHIRGLQERGLMEAHLDCLADRSQFEGLLLSNEGFRGFVIDCVMVASMESLHVILDEQESQA